MSELVNHSTEVFADLTGKAKGDCFDTRFSVFEDDGVVNLHISFDRNGKDEVFSAYITGASEIRQILNFLQFALKEAEANV